MNPIAVILPTYNERENIRVLIPALVAVISPKEILVVDDHSPDGTADQALAMSKIFPQVRVLRHRRRVGLTVSIQNGIASARQPYVAWMDADLSHPPELLATMYKKVKKYDVVVGSWLVPGGREERHQGVAVIYSRVINALCQLCFGTFVHAYTSGYILTKKVHLSDTPLVGDYGEYCIDFLVRQRARSRTILEIPYHCRSRLYGSSKTASGGYIKRGWRYLLTVVHLLSQGYAWRTRNPARC